MSIFHKSLIFLINLPINCSESSNTKPKLIDPMENCFIELEKNDKKITEKKGIPKTIIKTEPIDQKIVKITYSDGSIKFIG